MLKNLGGLSILFVLLSGCTSIAGSVNAARINASGQPKIIAVEHTIRDTTIILDKAESYEFLTIYSAEEDSFYTKSKPRDGNKFTFKTSNKPDCLYVIYNYDYGSSLKKDRKFLTPNGVTPRLDWCTRNNVAMEHRELKARIAETQLLYPKRKSQFDVLKARKSTFPKSCINPEPISIPQPASFCADPEKVKQKQNQCLAPIIRTGCNLSLNELSELDENAAERLGVPLACMQLTNVAVNKRTTGMDLVGAGVQSVLSSFSGKRGNLADIASAGYAWLRYKGCEGNIESLCNPVAPVRPDCSDWKTYQEEIDELANEVALIEYIKVQDTQRLSELENKVSRQTF